MSDPLGYLDFEVNIARTDEANYSVRVNSLGGRAEGRFVNPFTPERRAIIQQTLTMASLRTSARVRSSSVAEARTMKDIGQTLFEQAFRDQVREFYYRCLGQANEQGKGLRLRFVVDPSLNTLPWEFLALPPQKDFLALDPKTPIVRYIELPTPASALKAELPLRLLVVIASPKDQVLLDTEAEKRRIAAALAPLEKEGLMRVSFIEGPDTWPRLIDTLRPNETHILHFIGHGTFDEQRQEGLLVMEAEDGHSRSVGSEELHILLQGRSRLRLVVLNSCLGTQTSESEPFASVAASMVRAGVPAVIAMQFEVSDRAAQIIAGTFYKSLALDFPVDAALTEARRQIFLLDRDSLEWATPVIYMQVPDGQLFNITRGPVPKEPIKDTSDENQPPVAPEESLSAQEKARRELNARAEERYQAAELAAARGDWESALRGYRGATLMVPNFKDAVQKAAYVERRYQCVKLYEQAQERFRERQYAAVLDTLTQIRGIDPRWVDPADLQALATCGVTYTEALTALRQGEQARGAELLRQVIAERPDFEDVILRLDNLAAGGNGLFGEASASPEPPKTNWSPPQSSRPPSQSDQQTPPAAPGERVYEVSRCDLGALAEELHQYFLRNGFQSQVLTEGSTMVVQGEKRGLRSFVGMAEGATVRLDATPTGFRATIGGGKWIEGGAAVAVSMFILWPLAITGGVGLARNKILADTLWKTIDGFAQNRGGRRAA
jgi:type II secretory pathway pseudopilin PulG